MQKLTDKCVFRCRQSNVRRRPPAYDYCQALLCCLNCAQRFDYHALGSSQRLGGAAEHLIDGGEKFVGWALNFRVRMLLKGAVRSFWTLLKIMTYARYFRQRGENTN